MEIGFVKRNFFLWHLIFAVALIGAGFAAGRYFALNNEVKTKAVNPPILSGVVSNENDEVTLSSGAKLALGARLIFLTHYTKDDRITAKSITVSSPLIGMDEQDLAAYYDTWKMESFKESGAVLSKTIDSYSEGTYILTVTGEGEAQVLAVYSYDDNGVRHLIKTLESPLSNFDEATRQSLTEGIAAKDRFELEQLLQEYDE